MVTEYSLKISAFTVEAVQAIKDCVDVAGSGIDVFELHAEKRPYWFEATAFDDDEPVFAGPDGRFAKLAKQFPDGTFTITFVTPQGFGLLTSSFERRLKGALWSDSFDDATDELFEMAAAGILKTHDIRRMVDRGANLNALSGGHGLLFRMTEHNGALIEYCLKKGMKALGPRDEPAVLAQSVLEHIHGRIARHAMASILIGDVPHYKSNLGLMNDAVKSNDRYAASAAALLGLNARSYVDGHPDAEAWLKKTLPRWLAAA